MADADALLVNLRAVLPESRVEVEPATVAGKLAGEERWSITIQPRSEQDVSKTLKVAANHEIPVRIGGRSPQGRAALWPGGVVRIDMTNLHDVCDLDLESQLVRVRVGISVSILRAVLRDSGLTTGWDLRVDEPHTLGAVLAGVVPVACGPLYGTPAESIRSLTVVLPSGDMLKTKVAPRSATGPGLNSIFLNTHGRLGVLIEATLRVFRQPEVNACYVCRVPAAAFANLLTWMTTGPLPHRVEAHVFPDGQAEVLISIHGTKRIHDAAYQAAERALCAPLEPVTGVGVVPQAAGERSFLPWVAITSFVDIWRKDPLHTGFQFANASAYGVYVFGGGELAHLEARRQLAAIATTSETVDDLLLTMKRVLDPKNLLGELLVG